MSSLALVLLLVLLPWATVTGQSDRARPDPLPTGQHNSDLRANHQPPLLAQSFTQIHLHDTLDSLRIEALPAVHADPDASSSGGIGSLRIRDIHTNQVWLHLHSDRRNDLFAYATTWLPDLNNDTWPDLAIAIPNAADPATLARRGIVRIVSGFDASTIRTIEGQPGELFGTSLAALHRPGHTAPILMVRCSSIDETDTVRRENRFFDLATGDTLDLADALLDISRRRTHADRLHAGVPGDLNGDLIVNLDDFQILLDAVGDTLEPGAETAMASDPLLALALPADLNHDGVVDDSDLTLFAAILEDPNTPTDPGATPGAGAGARTSQPIDPQFPPDFPLQDGPLDGPFELPDVSPPPAQEENHDGSDDDNGALDTANENTDPSPGGDSDGPPEWDRNGNGVPDYIDPDSPFYQGVPGCWGPMIFEDSCDAFPYPTDRQFFGLMDTNRDGTVNAADRCTSLKRPGAIVMLPSGDSRNRALLRVNSPITQDGEWKITCSGCTVWYDRESVLSPVLSNHFYDADATPMPSEVWVQATFFPNTESLPKYGSVTLEIKYDCTINSSTGLRSHVYFTPVDVKSYQIVSPAFNPAISLRPGQPVNDSSPPRLEFPDLDISLHRSMPGEHEYPRASQVTNEGVYGNVGLKVDGAVTDGASLCVVRLEPLLLEGQWDDTHYTNVRVPNLRIHIRKRSDHNVTEPAVVGTLTEALRPQDDPWNIDNWNNPLPLLPTPWPLPPDTSSECGFRDGLAFFVPPEAYAVKQYVPPGSQYLYDEDSPPGTFEQPGDEEECEMEFVVTLGEGPNPTVIGRVPFWLRRPPIVFVHGLGGAGQQGYGNDDTDYWSQDIYNELSKSPVPTRLYFADYGATSLQGYAENFAVVPETIKKSIDDYRLGRDDYPHHSVHRGFSGRRYAATRADVIAHSMGGCLVRWYVADILSAQQSAQREVMTLNGDPIPGDWPTFSKTRPSSLDYQRDDNFGAGDIRRFISVGTPYQGSPLGNFASELLYPERPVAGSAAQQQNIEYQCPTLAGGFTDSALPIKALDEAASREAVIVLMKAIGWFDRMFPDGDPGEWVIPTGRKFGRGFEISGGEYVPPTAVADLAVDSTAWGVLDNAHYYPTGHRSIVWRAISTEVNPVDPAPQHIAGDFIWSIFNKYLLRDELTPGNSDIVVPINSQRNASSPQSEPNYTIASHYRGIAHIENDIVLNASLPSQTKTDLILHDIGPHSGIVRLLSSLGSEYRDQFGRLPRLD